MKHWFRDAHFRSLLKNSGYLAGSKAVAAVAGIATLAFAGRGLGVVLFGTLILITSYAKAASGLSKFQSWQLIVRYGGQALAAGDHEEFKASTGFAFALDVVSGIGGMIVAVMLLPFIGGWIGVTGQYLWLAMLYCTLLPTMGAATPVGVLRALDRFDLISWQGSSYPIVRGALAGIAFAAGSPLEIYVAIWWITDLGGDLFLWYLAWRELRRRGLLKGIRPTLRPETLPGAWRFAIQVNLTSSLITAWGPIARLVVGGLLGAIGAGLFRVASSLADSAQKPADLLAKAFYPEVVRMDLATKKPWKLMLRGTALAGAACAISILILIIVGKPLINLLFGKDFIGAYPVILVLIIAPVLAIVSFPLPSMLYALDRPDAPLTARLIGTIIFFVIVAPLSWTLGVIGAAIAFVIGNAAMVIVLIGQLLREYRRVRA
ncbi:MAG TPA: lipopolysaccharide biosynthesis protein [Sphingomicrobium sp.]|nr:lipopolysaccharide biosynthesis protein [Sphingomicrobium sp.]